MTSSDCGRAEVCTSDAMASPRRGMRVSLLSVVLSVVLAAVKIISGIVGSSYVLIADGIESVLDVFSSLVVWGSIRFASIPPDENHPYGHGRAEPLGAVVVSMVLMAVALGICFQSLREISYSHSAPAPFTLVVLLGVIAIKECMFRFLLRTSSEIGSAAVRSDAWHQRADALTSVSAFIGISVSLLGGEGYEAADDFAAVFASFVIFYNGAKLFKASLDEVMDVAVAPDMERDVREAASAVDGVSLIEKCRIRKSGLTYFVEIHVEVDGEVSVFEGHETAHRVKEALLRAHPSIADVVIHVEPYRG